MVWVMLSQTSLSLTRPTSNRTVGKFLILSAIISVLKTGFFVWKIRIHWYKYTKLLLCYVLVKLELAW